MGTRPKVLKPVGDCPFTSPTETGFKSVDIYEVDNAKLGDAIEQLGTYQNQYVFAVPGYNYKVEVVVSAKDALRLVGMQFPTK